MICIICENTVTVVSDNKKTLLPKSSDNQKSLKEIRENKLNAENSQTVTVTVAVTAHTAAFVVRNNFIIRKYKFIIWTNTQQNDFENEFFSPFNKIM